MSRTVKDERQGDIFALLDAPPPPPPAPRLPTADELHATHGPPLFGCFATEAQAEADAAKFRTAAEPITVQRVGDQWNVYRWNAKPKPEGEEDEGELDDPNGPDAATLCVTCGEEGAAAEFVMHDEAGGPLCPECHREREASCEDCGARFDTRNRRGGAGTRRFVRPSGKCICWRCNEWVLMNKPAPELAKDEATPEAMILFGKLAWIDERD